MNDKDLMRRDEIVFVIIEMVLPCSYSKSQEIKDFYALKSMILCAISQNTRYLTLPSSSKNSF